LYQDSNYYIIFYQLKIVKCVHTVTIQYCRLFVVFMNLIKKCTSKIEFHKEVLNYIKKFAYRSVISVSQRRSVLCDNKYEMVYG